jgi:hypothetical protein
VLYCLAFILNILVMMFLRTNLEQFLHIFFNKLNCAVKLEMFSCFEVNIMLRNSFAMFLFFLINASLVASRTKYSIYFNEKLWVLKLLIFIVCLTISLSVSLYFIFSFALISKYLSIGIQIFMLVIVHDSMHIIFETSVMPRIQGAGRCIKYTKITFGYVLPGILILGIIGLNFA